MSRTKLRAIEEANDFIFNRVYVFLRKSRDLTKHIVFKKKLTEGHIFDKGKIDITLVFKNVFETTQ